MRGKGKEREGGEGKGRRERSPSPPFQIPGSAPADHKPLAVTFSSLVRRDPCVLNNGGIVNTCL